jgi:hypothetical protein
LVHASRESLKSPCARMCIKAKQLDDAIEETELVSHNLQATSSW